MKDILQDIIATKRQTVEQQKHILPAETLRRQVNLLLQSADTPFAGRSMSCTLAESSTGIIAEFKRKSPSKGWFNPDARADIIPQSYALAGASALSILTDSPYFGGNTDDLQQARATTDCPILRKDFIIDEYQILESRLIGADAILLIAAALDLKTCIAFTRLAHELGLEVLLEIHSENELDYISCSPDMTGVNNRHLGTFHTDVASSFALAERLPSDMVKVSESGISSPSTVRSLREAGYRGFLIGETFMRTPSPADTLSTFIQSILS